MHSCKIDNLSLQQIADSGQCFRWQRIDDNHYSVVAFGKLLEMWQEGNEFTFSCDKSEWQDTWVGYFDLETDYGSIIDRINNSGDEYLMDCASFGSGVRILKQDLWETIVSFIISQNNNIKRISKSVELLCQAAGLPNGAFPGPGQVDTEVFYDRSMGFGYRSEYLDLIYKYYMEHPEWLDSLREMSYEEAMEDLMSHKGIGRKVANCICLFGLHHVEAFPIDTHVKQILAAHYSEGFPFDYYEGVAGIVQQYMFYHKLTS